MLFGKLTIDSERFLIKLTFYIFKIFGVSTMALNSNYSDKKMGTRLFKSSKTGIIYNTILACAIMPMTYSGLNFIINIELPELSERTVFDRMVDIVQFALCIITCEIILVAFSFRQHQTIRTANDLVFVHRLVNVLDNRGSRRRNSTLKRHSLLLFTMNIPFWSLGVIMARLHYIEGILYCVALFFSYFVIACAIMQYSVSLTLINQLYKAVNNKLLEFSRKNFTGFGIQLVQRKNSQTELDKIIHLRKSYSMLSSISRKLSSSHSEWMLPCTLHIFVTLIVSSFYVLILMRQGSLTLELGAECFLHAYINFFPLIILTRCVSSTIAESKRTGRIVSDCLDNTEDREIRRELESFSNYLLHNNVEFSVFDLFSLNGTLLISITGTTTTYLIIVLQFRENSD